MAKERAEFIEKYLPLVKKAYDHRSISEITFNRFLNYGIMNKQLLRLIYHHESKALAGI